MVFSSFVFLFVFLALHLLAYAFAPDEHKNKVLLVSSLIFYAWGGPRYLLLLMGETAVCWGLALVIQRSEDDMRRWILSKLSDNLPYLYIYTGAGDELEQRVFQSTEAVYDMLTECYPYDLLNEVILFENSHNEKAWAEIFPDFLHTFLS